MVINNNNEYCIDRLGEIVVWTDARPVSEFRNVKHGEPVPERNTEASQI